MGVPPKTTNHLFVGEWDGNQYQNFYYVRLREDVTLRSVFGTAFLGLCLTTLVLSLWNLSHYDIITIHTFHLNTTHSISNTMSDKFLSFGLDSSLLRNMKRLPVENEKFVILAKHLSPAFVRVGGTSADCLFFNETTRTTSPKILNPVNGQDISNFTINGADFQALHSFATKSQLRMIFDLNVLIRKPDNSWDSSNAQDIISFAKSHNMDLDWQLGNEPNSFPHVFNVTITPKQLAKDYRKAREILDNSGYNKSILVGPEVNHVGDTNHKGELYAKIFLENDGDSVNYVTWHQYYLNGRQAKVKDFINPSTFESLSQEIRAMQNAINTSGKKISMWLSETSTAFGGGAAELSDRFIAGFLWLDKLGYSARAGVNVVTRQSFFGENYALVGNDIEPNPDWWVSVLFKQFVSEKVLKLTPVVRDDYVRLYAHCTAKKSLVGGVPAITIYGVNLNNVPAPTIIPNIIPVPNETSKIFFYALTSDHLQSRQIQLNGEILKLLPNGELPRFRPIVLESPQLVVLPSYSMVFIVIHGIELPACLS